MPRFSKFPHRLLSLCGSLAIVSFGFAQERVALVIGNSAYNHFGALDNPKQDLAAMRTVFSEMNYRVTHGSDLSTAKMKELVADFARKNRSAKEIIFYFSGHGLQVQGENFLTGVDSKLDIAEKERLLRQLYTGDKLLRERESFAREQARKSMLSLDQVLGSLESMGNANSVRVAILDCCRNNPMGTKSVLGGQGLARVDPPSGMLVAFAARAGAVAEQTKRGALSLYTDELVKALKVPGLEVEDVFKQVRRGVIKRSGSGQMPAEYSLLTGDLIFRRGGAARVAKVIVPPQPPRFGVTPKTATKARPFVNGLGMKFVPVPGTNTLFCIHETRVMDYAAYAKVNSGVDDAWKDYEYSGHKQGPDHPVLNVNWEDARAFCAWLSAQDGAKVSYRLPSDHEWSVAVGIGGRENASASPKDKNGKIEGVYPWGTAWPPSRGAGNYRGEEYDKAFDSKYRIEGYTDSHTFTAPVGSYNANSLGLHDLGGNVYEWCADWYSNEQTYRVLRGGSWYYISEFILRSSYRYNGTASYRINDFGFRVVLESGG